MKKILNFLKKILKPTRTKVITVLSLTFLFLSINEIKSRSNGIAGYTGALGQNNCSNCHSGSAVANANLTVTGGFTNLTSGAQYELSTTYEGFITINYTGKDHWGFDIEILNAQGNNAGILILTDAVYGHFGTIGSAPYIRRDLIHTDMAGDCSSPSIPNTFTYRFQWVSPAVPMGTVTLYYVGLATDNSCGSSGDYMKLGNVSYTAPPL